MLLNKVQKLILKLSLKTNKSLFLVVSFINAVLIFCIIICLIYLFNQRNLLDNCGKSINQELVNLASYRNISFDLVKRNNFDDDFYSSGFDNSGIISKQLVASRDKISELENKVSVKNIHFKENFKALIADYESLQKENELLIEYLIQIGNEESGLYSKVLITIDDFKSKFVTSGQDRNFSNNYDRMVSSIHMLKSTKDELVIHNIQSLIDEMMGQLSVSKPDSSNYMVFRVYDALQNVNNSFQQYARKTLEIGKYPDKGLMNKLFQRYNKIEARLKDSLEIIYAEKTSRNVKAIVIIVVLIFLLLALNLFTFYFFIKREKGYRLLFEKYIDYLNKGVQFEIKDDDVLPDVYILVSKFKYFASKFIHAEKILEKIALGNWNIEISKENQFETFHSSFLKIKAGFENLSQQISIEKRSQSQMIWIKNGIDKLTHVMRREYGNPLLHANEIINMLVDYLKVPLGAIYLISEENGVKYVEMASAFAYGREKQHFKKIAVGEGIVGTAASEKKTLNVTNIPENYFNVISGFGETKPKNIVASPIKLNEDIFGVIELASLSRFKDEEISFIEEVCKTVAYSFAISKVYLDAIFQIENSNLQIAELEAENELLKNDYNDISNELKLRSAKSFDNDFLVSRLNDFSIRLTLDVDGNILEVNSRFEHLLRTDRKKFIQSNYRDFMADAILPENIDFEINWKDIRSGSQKEIDSGLTIAGQEYWLKQYFYPEKDDLGRVIKIQVIAFDITEKIKLQKELDNLKSS